MTLVERFTAMLTRYKRCISEKKVFQGYMKDLFPDAHAVTVMMVELYSRGIVDDIKSQDILDSIMLQRYIKILKEEQGADTQCAIEAIKLWFYGYGEAVLGKRISADFNESKTPLESVIPEEFDDKGFDPAIPEGLSEYLNALRTEVFYLRSGGGKQYIVTNGQLYDIQNGLYVYSFELESEIFLSDDAPLTIYVGSKSANGSVLTCEGFHILIKVDMDFGPEVKKAYITVEPWKLLETLREKLQDYSQLGHLSKMLLEKGPQLVLRNGKMAIVRGQDEARACAINNKITVIWGPPGTGKTYTMSNIALDALKAGLSVLMVSHSNISVDGAVESLIERLNEENYLKEYKKGLYLRYGYVRSPNLQQDDYAVSYNYALKNRPEIAQEMDALNEEKKKLKSEKGIDKQKIVDIDEKLKRLRKEIRDEEKKYISRAKYVATTISRVTINAVFDGKDYDVVMFDEASMAYVPQVVYAASLAKKHFICVGDFFQLPPIAQSSAQQVLMRDIFQYLGISNDKGEINNHKWLVMLDVQRRMHSSIAAFSNEYVYGGILKNYEGTDANRADIINKPPLSEKPVCLVDLSGTYCAASKDGNNSRFNILAAIIDFANALTAQKAGEGSIGIVSPYKAQTRLVQAFIQDEFGEEDNNILCSTVHSFQGYERNLMIFDPVESYPTSKAGFLLSRDLYQVKRLINVAVTRARGKLVVVSYANFWRQQFDGSKNLCYLLINYLSDTMAKGNKKRQHLLKKYLESLDYGKSITYYPEVTDGIDSLLKDIDKAKSEIIVSMPDASMMESDESKEIFIRLTQTLKRGIGIKIFITQKTKMPPVWQEYTEIRAAAVFPLILIDEKILWYGLPAYANGFEFKDGTVTVNMQMIYRIRGKLATGMIGNMTEMIGADLIMENPNTGERTVRNGLSEYVYNMASCTKCGSHMVLSKKNKYHLRCENCSSIEYVPVDMLREYISNYDVRCPIDGGRLKAGISKMGIYVRCEKGHFVELNRV